LTHPLLVHELRIWTIVNHLLAKHRRGEFSIHILSVEIGMFSIEDKIIPLWAKKHSRGFAKENKRKAIPVLSLAVEEELIRIDAVLDGAADEGENVEYHRGAVRVREP
jgi:hypothetical protein